MESLLSELSSGFGAKLPRVANEAYFYLTQDKNCTTSCDSTRTPYSLLCSLSKNLQKTPVRTKSCEHVDTVDLRAWLKSCAKSDLISLYAKFKLSSKVDTPLTCPICKAKGSLYVDAIIENFISSNPTEKLIYFTNDGVAEHIIASEVTNQSIDPIIQVKSVEEKEQEAVKFHWDQFANSPNVWSMGRTVGQTSVADKMEKAMLNVKPRCVETMTSPRSPSLWWESQPSKSPALWWEIQGRSPAPCKTPTYSQTPTFPCKSPTCSQTPTFSLISDDTVSPTTTIEGDLVFKRRHSSANLSSPNTDVILIPLRSPNPDVNLIPPSPNVLVNVM